MNPAMKTANTPATTPDTVARLGQFRDRLRQLLGSRGVLSDPTDMAPYLVDWREAFHGQALAVARPETTDQVADIVRLCASSHVSVVPQGGNTGLVGGATPLDQDQSRGEQLVLSLSRMNRIRDLDPLDHTITVEAGCILADIQAAAAAAGRYFPLSLGAQGSCQIGGNIATNAGGVNVLRYGNARDLVLGLEVVLADGRVWNGLRRLRKDNTGYDLKQLMIGSEGTLGIITAAVLRLFPHRRESVTALLAVPSVAAALEIFVRLRADGGDELSSAELMDDLGCRLALKHVPGLVMPLAASYDHYLLAELSTSRRGADLHSVLESVLEEAMADGLVLDGTVAANQTQIDALWRLREGIVEGQRLEGVQLKHDIAVPVSRVPALIDQAGEAVRQALPGVRVVAFGHLGDGNIHFNLSPPEGATPEAFLERADDLTRTVYDVVAGMDGSISAEHGVGQLKREAIGRYKPAVEVELMARVKRALDADGTLNPGKVVPHPEGARPRIGRPALP